LNILFVYYNLHSPLRPTLSAGLDAFRLYSGHRVFMWNAALRRGLGLLREVRFELVVFSTVFLSQHWGGPLHFERLIARVRDIGRLDAVKVAFPQDEFYSPDLYCRFFNELRVDVIYSVAAPDTWPLIYRRLEYTPRFHRVLTGYIDERKQPAPGARRDIDIGYRTIGQPTPAYGAFGYRKWTIAERFRQACAPRRLKVDISTDDRDKFVGDGWYDFLARCKYVLGVESGTSVVDHDGTVTSAIRRFERENPGASFEAVAQACLGGLDGRTTIRALGPRHLEACLTRTCQILMEGDYNGILRAGRHYIAVKPDFSNVEEVLDSVERDDRRAEIVENAWLDIVDSGRYTYRAFVGFVLETALANRRAFERSAARRKWEVLAYGFNVALDAAGWLLIRWILAPARRIAAPVRRRFPVFERALQGARQHLG
jgi:hypothetical protein